MKDNKFINTIKNPPKWLIILTFCFTLIFAGGAIALVVLNLSEKFYSYILYCLSALFLTYAVYIVVIYAPKIKKAFIESLKKHKFTKRIYEDYSFRTVVFASSALVINLIFGIFEIVMGAVGRSIWFGSLGTYHLILTFTRFGIIYNYYKQRNNNEMNLEKKLQTYRNTGICILVFNLALVGAMAQMIFSRRAFEYAGLMIFVMATYAFYKITVSIIGIFKAKKYNDYGTQSLRNLNLTDAMVSVYALQTALIATFSVEQGTDMGFMNIITGVVVTVISLVVGIYMIVKSNKENKKLKREENKDFTND